MLYEIQGGYRVEIFCSGVYRKEIYYCDQPVLLYEGYSEECIEQRKAMIGTVIFNASPYRS